MFSKQSLLGLPIELLDMIIQKVVFGEVDETEAIRKLGVIRLACWPLARIASRMMFATVTFRKFRTHSTYTTPPGISESNSPFGAIGRVLEIGFSERTWAHPNKYDAVHPRNISREIATLRHVSVVNWCLEQSVSEDEANAVISGLCQLPQLTRTHIRCGEQFLPPLPLVLLEKVRILCIAGTNSSVLNQMVPFIAPLLITRVTDMRLEYPLGQFLPMNPQLFSELCGTRMPLQRLTLQGRNITLDAASIKHLTNLTSLDISGGLYFPQGSSKMWRAFEDERIKLREVAIGAVTEAFLNYLESYLGLESFSTVEGDLYVEDDPDTGFKTMSDVALVTNRLYQQTLPRHRESLLSYRDSTKTNQCAPRYMSCNHMRSLSACQRIERMRFTIEECANRIQEPEVHKQLEIALTFPDIKCIELDSSFTGQRIIRELLSNLKMPYSAALESAAEARCTIRVGDSEGNLYVRAGDNNTFSVGD